jgi:hypothetical protein
MTRPLAFNVLRPSTFARGFRGTLMRIRGGQLVFGRRSGTAPVEMKRLAWAGCQDFVSPLAIGRRTSDTLDRADSSGAGAGRAREASIRRGDAACAHLVHAADAAIHRRWITVDKWIIPSTTGAPWSGPAPGSSGRTRRPSGPRTAVTTPCPGAPYKAAGARRAERRGAGWQRRTVATPAGRRGRRLVDVTAIDEVRGPLRALSAEGSQCVSGPS